MMRSLYAGVSGLRNHQTRMDVVGNNIANVNTIGYKKSRTVFQDMMSQTLSAASAPTANTGGRNPIQVGLGMSLGSIDVLHTQGPSMATGNNLDVMIQGDGYFMVGNISPDFWDGKLDETTGKLDGEIDVEELLGSEGDVIDPSSIQYTRAGNLTFDERGFLVCSSTGKYVLGYAREDGEGNDEILVNNLSLIHVDIDKARNVAIDPAGYITYIAGDNEDGEESGTIKTFGSDFNGAGIPIAIAKFNNPMGLEKTGSSMYRESSNSGRPQVGAPGGPDGQGIILPGNLEMSNVDLAEEFTEMIITQRGHQANARTIRTSDEMLQELAQLKR